jgi:hypothetical protein
VQEEGAERDGDYGNEVGDEGEESGAGGAEDAEVEEEGEGGAEDGNGHEGEPGLGIGLGFQGLGHGEGEGKEHEGRASAHGGGVDYGRGIFEAFSEDGAGGVADGGTEDAQFSGSLESEFAPQAGAHEDEDAGEAEEDADELVAAEFLAGTESPSGEDDEEGDGGIEDGGGTGGDVLLSPGNESEGEDVGDEAHAAVGGPGAGMARDGKAFSEHDGEKDEGGEGEAYKDES